MLSAGPARPGAASPRRTRTIPLPITSQPSAASRAATGKGTLPLAKTPKETTSHPGTGLCSWEQGWKLLLQRLHGGLSGTGGDAGADSDPASVLPLPQWD